MDKEIDFGQEHVRMAFQELTHQLRAPLRIARAKIDATVKIADSQRLRTELQTIGALCAKAEQLVGHYAYYFRPDVEFHLNAEPLASEDLASAIIRIASDFELLVDPARSLHIDVDRSSMRLLDALTVNADLPLLEQALVNIVDNATKYSFPRTSIAISASVTTDREFVVSVSNIGLQLTEADIEQSKTRGWRGHMATQVTPAGQGLGLWIARSIANAHGGRLEILPTDSKGLTEVIIALPAKERNR